MATKHLDQRNVFILVSDPTATLTTGTGKAYWRVPVELNGYNIERVLAVVFTQSTSGLPTAMVRRTRSGTAVDVLSTAVTIDANETDSSTAATPPVINSSNKDLATGDLISVDVSVAGTGTKGLGIELLLRNP